VSERILLDGNREVYRVGDTIERAAKPWSQSVWRFLRHLQGHGLPVEQIISVDENHEISRFVDAEMVHPNKWDDGALFEVGQLVAKLHSSSRSFSPASGDIWQKWCLREIGNPIEHIICHGDIAPWNMLTKNGKPHLLIDWEYTGPCDPIVELARVCWLFPQLFDDDLQKILALPSPKKRAEQVRIIAEGYGLRATKRNLLINQIIEVIICETAHEAITPDNRPTLTPNCTGSLWGFAWRTRSLYWVWRHKDILQKALD